MESTLQLAVDCTTIEHDESESVMSSEYETTCRSCGKSIVMKISKSSGRWMPYNKSGKCHIMTCGVDYRKVRRLEKTLDRGFDRAMAEKDEFEPLVKSKARTRRSTRTVERGIGFEQGTLGV